MNALKADTFEKVRLKNGYLFADMVNRLFLMVILLYPLQVFMIVILMNPLIFISLVLIVQETLSRNIIMKVI